MRYALIMVLGVCYFLGWLPASFVVPALMVFSVLRVPTGSVGRTHRRPGYIVPPSPASAGASLGTAQRVATYTGFSTPPGDRSEVRTAFMPLAGLSKISEPGSYMSDRGFSLGPPLTAAERLSRYMAPSRWADFKPLPEPEASAADTLVTDAHGNWISGGGDCGCGDTAA